jgi:hypothetical protein
MAGYNFASKFGLKALSTRRSRGPGSFGGGGVEREDLGYQPLSEIEQDRKYGPVGSKSRAYYEKLRGANFEQSRKFSKDMAVQQQKESTDQFNREKEFIGKWTELVLKAREVGDITLQKHLLSYGRDYIETLSYGTRQLLEPIIRAGPFDPAKAKLEKYDELNPAPGITADREKQPLAHAQQVFAQEDWRAGKVHFATGQTPTKRNFIPAGGKEGNYYTRDKDGNVSIATEEDLQLDDFAKRYGTTKGEVIQNGGAYGKPVKTVVNGVAQEYRPFTGLDGSHTNQLVSGISQAEKNKEDQRLANTLSLLASGDEKLRKKDPLIQMIDAAGKKDAPFEETAAPILEKSFPGYTFIRPKSKAGIMDEVYDIFKSGDYVKGKSGIFTGGYVEGDADTIVARPGQRQVFQTPEGRGIKLVYDSANDRAYDTVNGREIGSLESALNGFDLMKRQEREFDYNVEERRRNMREQIGEDYSSTF